MSGFNVSFSGNKKIDVEFKNFKIKTDQSLKNGGDESAPDPFSIFIASLGACTGFFASSFCDVRKLSTEHYHLFVEVIFKKKQKLMDQVNITLYVDGNFPKKYIQPIIKSMNSCAVKNQLHPDITFNTSVVYPEK
ncbi:MAG: hypothetical protein HOG03_00560 [Desulfobacula sp.]|jgi:ribosomal protein S12 methylthiotransferase accessory factor|uniref:OsmC family protein n=2 Tax=Desulfobacula sp. TaxID=2593537 RepID=UPI001D841346|nr:hypothetical protein [Desulfobacula sp.]MBT3803069.1 hypothetical protein [Desulfobacula sp.]MBT4023418.1 hypothetical protein [Desulfobacula sp.]MBT4197117.1 hypothetical protein [Desulfobacula sp.]MBT4507324.1 hypothetical protein [Desulfobacula sp.]